MDLTHLFDGAISRDWQTVEDETLRIAMVGVGWWTREHAIPAVEASELCETTVLVSSSKEKAETNAAAVDTIECGLTYDEFHAGEATEHYDAVYVCTPNALHLPHVEAAAEHGKAVLCEKPMEASSERAERLVAACRDADVPLMVGYRMHTDPTIRRARELIRQGFIGEPVQVEGHMAQRLLEIIPSHDQWRLNPDLAGPGASVTDLGIYPLNTTRFLLDSDPVAVTASMYAEHEAFDAVPDERASFTVEYDGGVRASFAASQNAALSGHLRVLGTEGYLDFDPVFFDREDGSVTLVREGSSAEFDLPNTTQMTEEFDYFADRILGTSPIHPDGEHALLDVRAIEAVYEAAERGERVVVE